MEALTRGQVLELAPRSFNTLSPHTTDSPLLDRTLDDARATATPRTSAQSCR